MSPPPPRGAAQVLVDVANAFGRVYGSLGVLRARFADVAAEHGTLERGHVAGLRPAILDVLDAHRDLLAGAGVVTAPGFLADAHHWLEWWWGGPSQAVAPLRVSLDPSSPDYFDYTASDWYATVAARCAPHVAGPYVDYACTNEYALTLALPCGGPDRFAGIVAADMVVANLERWLMPRLCALDRPLVLVNAKGRVVASASAGFAPGVLVPANGSELIGLSRGAWRRAGVDPDAMGWALWDPAPTPGRAGP